MQWACPQLPDCRRSFVCVREIKREVLFLAAVVLQIGSRGFYIKSKTSLSQLHSSVADEQAEGLQSGQIPKIAKKLGATLNSGAAGILTVI